MDDASELRRENEELRQALALMTARYHLLLNVLAQGHAESFTRPITEPIPSFEDTQPISTTTLPPDTLPL